MNSETNNIPYRETKLTRDSTTREYACLGLHVCCKVTSTENMIEIFIPFRTYIKTINYVNYHLYPYFSHKDLA